jgi:hypothetical protein
LLKLITTRAVAVDFLILSSLPIAVLTLPEFLLDFLLQKLLQIISFIRRNIQGVKLINLDEEDQFIDITLCQKETSENISDGKEGEIIQEEQPDDNSDIPE